MHGHGILLLESRQWKDLLVSKRLEFWGLFGFSTKMAENDENCRKWQKSLKITKITENDKNLWKWKILNKNQNHSKLQKLPKMTKLRPGGPLDFLHYISYVEPMSICTATNNVTLQQDALRCILLHCIILYCTVLHWTAPACKTIPTDLVELDPSGENNEWQWGHWASGRLVVSSTQITMLPICQGNTTLQYQYHFSVLQY